MQAVVRAPRHGRIARFVNRVLSWLLPRKNGFAQRCAHLGGNGEVMTVSAESAAKFVCECSGWKATNLELQKILYIADVVHLGRHGRRLTDASYEAWDYGPVSPSLYRALKPFGAKPIPPSALWKAPPVSVATPEGETLKDACDHLMGKTAGDLIRNTHWSGGAWAKNYTPRANASISEADMLDEYANRANRSNTA